MSRVKGPVEIERRIDARPETVFSYLTDPERFRLWYGVDAELDPRPGGIFRVTTSGRSGTVVRGVYIHVEPPTRVVFTWGWENTDGVPEGLAELMTGTSTVEINLVADGDATVLRLRHGDLATEASCEWHSVGWGIVLERLAVVATGGDPGPDPFAGF